MIELHPPLHSVSERTQERFGIIRDFEHNYDPNDTVRRDLGHISLNPVIGPTAVGKSFVIDELVTLDRKFGKVRSFSTRDPRPDDTPDTMVCLPWDERHIKRICNVIEAGDAVQYAFHPKTGDVYGTTMESYPAEYNLLPALSNSVVAMEALPFRSIRISSLVTTPELWSKWFEQRAFASLSDRKARLSEAALALVWPLEHSHVAIINNREGDALKTARKIRHFALSDGTRPPRDEGAAEELLEYIRKAA